MEINYTAQDCIELAKIFKKYNHIDGYNWVEYVEGWIEEYDIDFIIETLIDCFICNYAPLGIEDSEINTVIYTIPFSKLTYLLSDISIEFSQGILAIFAEWRLTIKK